MPSQTGGPSFGLPPRTRPRWTDYANCSNNTKKAACLSSGNTSPRSRPLPSRSAHPLVTGKTPQAAREQIYDRFRHGELHSIVLSKVGNFAIDLPDADVLVQVSGMFGSRQEEAQRLGRILRPKANGRAAHFFTLVSCDTREEEFAHHRKLFLIEQGYPYQVVIADEP